MKISVIFTGGTIGSTVDDRWISPHEKAKYTLLNGYDGQDVEFCTHTPYTILSENLSATELNCLQTQVEKALLEDCDGVIVTHGTDTLQYTAMALEYAFKGCRVPVVIVSAAYPPEDPRTNAHANFKAAVEFIRSKNAGGVFVAYKNEHEDATRIHIPSRLLQHAECNSDVHSMAGKTYAIYDGSIFLCEGTLPSGVGRGIVKYVDNPGILVLDSHPGDSFSYDLKGVNAVVMKPYHSATLNTANPHLADFCSRAKDMGVPVYVVNVKSGVSYSSTAAFQKLGIIPLPYGTFVRAYMELWAEISTGHNIYKRRTV